MKATIEFEERLYRRLKAEAALRGRTVKELVAEGVRRVLDAPEAPARTARRRSRLPVLRKATSGKPILPVAKAELAEIELKEDLARYRRSFGR
jgi:hypothetical protein